MRHTYRLIRYIKWFWAVREMCEQRERESDNHHVSHIVLKYRIWIFFFSMKNFLRLFLLWGKQFQKITKENMSVRYQNLSLGNISTKLKNLFFKLELILCLLSMGYSTNILVFDFREIFVCALLHASLTSCSFFKISEFSFPQ